MWSALTRTHAILQKPMVSMEELVFSLSDVQVFQRKLEVQQQLIQQHSQEILRFEKDLQVLYKNQIMDSQYQSFKKRLDLLKRESSQMALSIQTMIQEDQKIYIASVQYILSTYRCLSKDGHRHKAHDNSDVLMRGRE